MTLNKIKALMFTALTALLMALFYFIYKPYGLIVATTATLITLVLLAHYINYRLKHISLNYIDNYRLPNIVLKKFMMENPQLIDEQVDAVIIALKQFFMMFALCQLSGNTPKKGFTMPSRIADELWHEFMLDSRNYELFCYKAFGKMLHHKPGLDNGGNQKMYLMKSFPSELKNTYTYVHQLQSYNKLYSIGGIALLFGIDAYLNIHDGFHYDAQVLHNLQKDIIGPTATSDNATSGGCGGLLATDTVGSCSSGSSSDSGGDSGGSCGGGCGD